MSPGRLPQLKLSLLRALLIAALPTACAVGVQPDLSDAGGTDTGGDSGSAAGGTGGMALAGMSGSLAQAGTTSPNGGSVTQAFGGTSSSGGKAGSGSGGSGGAGGAGKGGSAGAGGAGKGGSGGSGGGSGGSGGSSGGSGGGGGGSGGAGSGCTCKQTKAWTDGGNISWVTGDCLTTGGKTYLYTGTKMQMFANGDCNPAKQLTWCTDSNNDYKFMLCN